MLAKAPVAVKNLLIGAGRSRHKKIGMVAQHGIEPGWEGELVTLDFNPDVSPDVLWDLEKRPFPFEDETFDEIHAYDVLEHIGRQGDWRDFFDQYAEYWRLLKPNGLMGIVVPIGADAFADPGHGRFYVVKHFQLLSQQFYEAQKAELGEGGGDYRWYWKRNFDLAFHQEITGDNGLPHHLVVLLMKT